MTLGDHHPFRSAKAQARFWARYDLRAARWPVPSVSSMVDTSFGKTFVRISGPVEAPPMVLLHGVGGSSLQWAANIEALSASHRVFAIDLLYEHGRSVPVRPARTVVDLTDWLDEVRAGLGLENGICLVGLSYGGWLASRYALRFPERLSALVLLAPVFTVLPLSLAWIARAVLCVIPLRWFSRRFMDWLLEDLARRDEAGRQIVDEWTEDSFVAMRCFAPRRTVPPDLLSDDELRALRVPTLYLVGENEKIYAARDAVQRLRAVAPDIDAEVLPGAGHDLTIVRADLVNAKILAFQRR
ncbi:putative carboxylesterase [Minicystis rosea]|nr:putative carboxylesterase [Minicystis rosea]